MGCNIDKMLIKGIRSFSPDNASVIEFYRPLTIIVGQNGAGKTTIIECLKMACTGELPPNTRSGQSFIHDPKVAGETEVKAQIKLRFLTATRQPVVVIRSFQLTQKKTALQFKALDQVLQTINRQTGQKEALSYRCADIDRIVPSLMGVSKAILENVIFVHQEDSNWPLAEGQVLKKKFDDIFAATKYTKALEALRKLRSEKTQEVKELRLSLETLRSHKDVAAKLRESISDGTARVQKLNAQIAQLDGEMEGHQRRRGELEYQLSKIADFGDEVRSLRAKHDMLAAQNAETYARLLSTYGAEDMDVSLAELEEWEQSLQVEVADVDTQLKKLQREMSSRQVEVEAIKEQYTRDVKNQGRLAAEAEAHQRNCAERDRFIRQVAAEAGLPAPESGANGSVSPEGLAAFQRSFQAKLEEEAQRLDATKATNRSLDDEQGRGIDQVSTELSGSAEGVRMKQEQLRKNDATAAQLSASLEACVVNAGLLADAQQRLKDLEARLAAKQEALNGSQLDEEARKHGAALAELQAKASALRQERDRLASAADSAARMRYKSQEVAQKEEQVNTLLSGRRPKLDSLLGTRGGELPPREELRSRIEAALAQRKSEAASQAAALKDAQQKLAAAEGQELALSTQLHRAEGELRELGPKLQGGLREASCEPHARVADCAHAAEAERVGQSEQLQNLNAFCSISDVAKKRAQQQNLCVTCGRAFASGAELQQFLQLQDSTMANMPTRMEAVKRALEAADRKVQALRSLQPLAHRHDQLKESEIPALQLRLGEVRAELGTLREAVAELQEVYALADAEAQDGQRLLQDVAWPVDKLVKEIRERQLEVDGMRSEMAVASSTRTVSDVDNELEELDRQRAQHEQGREDCSRRLQRLRDEVGHLRTEYHKAREDCMRLSSAADKRTALEAQLQELNAENERIQQQIGEAQASRRPLEEKRAKLQQERDKWRAEARQREGELEARLRQLHTLETQLQAKQRAIEEYERGGKAEALQRTNQTLEGLKQRQAAGEAAVKELQAQVRTIEDESRDKSGMNRQVADLLGYQRAKAQQATMGAQLDGINAQMGQVGDQAGLQEELQHLEGVMVKLRSDRDKMEGSIETVEENVKSAKGEVAHPQYDQIEQRYREHLIRLKTTEMANSDLEKYHKALEKALLAFHTSKMADINKVIKELWQKTYRNSDIDYIAIRTDAEGGASRSYNYRVVMYCGGAELDMRGRCSAGQKVLACLIIRLALAETFCLNCGILALDEPTTNLDAANAASLAESLRAIMTSRRDQENFQLVVITHDEQFAHLIGTREYCEALWRITKDPDQHTLISQEEIGE